MEEKGKTKIKLSTAVLLFIIFVLIIALGIVYYFGFIKDNKNISNSNVNKDNMIATNTIQGNTNNVLSNVISKYEAKTLAEGVEKNLIGTYAFEKRYSSNEAGRTADIYALKIDGTEVKIAENVTPRNMWYDNGKLYFTTIYAHYNNQYYDGASFSYTTIDLTNSEHNMNTFQLDDYIQLDDVVGSVGDTIYYLDSSAGYSIMTYSINDKFNSLLYTSESIIRNMYIGENKELIYFLEDGDTRELILRSYNIKTGHTTEILRFTSCVDQAGYDGMRFYPYKFVGNQFIYQDSIDGFLYSYNLENNEKIVILKDIVYSSFLFKEGNLYYSKVENGKCSIVKTDGKNNEVIYTEDFNEGFYLEFGDYGIGKLDIGFTNGATVRGKSIVIDTSGNELDEQVFELKTYKIR